MKNISDLLRIAILICVLTLANFVWQQSWPALVAFLMGVLAVAFVADMDRGDAKAADKMGERIRELEVKVQDVCTALNLTKRK